MADEVQLLPATPAMAEELARTMRPEDAAEVFASSGKGPHAALVDSIERSDGALALLFDGEVAAMWGVAPVPGTAPTLLGGPLVGVVWLLTGAAVSRRRNTFLRLCRPAVRGLLRRYPVLVNAIDARYQVAVRWARWLGFRVDEPVPFGFEGRPFHFISLRRSDRV